MSIDYTIVPSSQIMPVSGIPAGNAFANLKEESENFFFKKSLNSYKVFKNAYASALGTSKHKQDFFYNFLRILEETMVSSQGEAAAEKKLIIKSSFEIIKQNISIMVNAGIDLDVEQFLAALMGFLAGKLR